MIRLFNRYWLGSAAVALVTEAVLLVGSFALGHRLRSWVFFGVAEPGLTLYSPGEFWIRASMFAVTILLFLYVTGLYDFGHRISTRTLGIKILQSIAFSALTLWGLYFLIPSIAPGRAVFSLSLGLAIISLSLWRLLLTWLLISRRLFVERILIVGSDDAAKALASEAVSREHLGYKVVGFLSDDPSLQGLSLVNPRVIGTTAQACELALAHDVTRVVVAQQDSRGKVSMDSLLKCKTRGIHVARGSSYYEQLTGKVMLDGPRVKSWLIFSSGFLVSRSASIAKRIVDVAIASIGILIAAPLMAVIGLAVRLDSRGPAFYSQKRVGLHGKIFTLWKFRTMRLDAESTGTPKWAATNDPRVTRVGRFLRKSRLDELPQLWNVLRGEMSLVGPRPERKAFVDELTAMYPLYEERLAVRPGLTGWAQIRAPYAASLEESVEKLRYDLYYVKNLSVFLDLSILGSTLRIVIFGRGAR